ncbi:hypothetical protein FALBO_4525 [Fusarium albosuccineum]|uniref:Uncharacterized protein n=1 Tax=Fusarium albosuccineum TaxID=1237068 RepID=A0A8H4LGY7_9HYPO|nr:hypothetical protein FALBO_4525 [Fusarium albosuccineum]
MPNKPLFNKAQAFWDRVKPGRRSRRYADVAADERRARNNPGGRLPGGGSLPRLRRYPTIDLRASLPGNTLEMNPPPYSPPRVSPGHAVEEAGPSAQAPIVPAGPLEERGEASAVSNARPWNIPGYDLFPLNLHLMDRDMDMFRPMDANAFKGNGNVYHEFLSGAEDAGIPDDVFIFLLETFLTTNGFIGDERKLNLPLILSGLSTALNKGMTQEVKKLTSTINRHVCLRMFYHNPHEPLNAATLPRHYFAYRSEEIYRSWVLVRNDDRLGRHITLNGLVKLYVCMVAHNRWPDLTANFDQEFKDDINFTYESIGDGVENLFFKTFCKFFDRSGLGTQSWMKHRQWLRYLNRAERREKAAEQEDAAEQEEAPEQEEADINIPQLEALAAAVPRAPPVVDEQEARRIRRQTVVMSVNGNPKFYSPPAN